jgi:hypothetical protein
LYLYLYDQPSFLPLVYVNLTVNRRATIPGFLVKGGRGINEVSLGRVLKKGPRTSF